MEEKSSHVGSLIVIKNTIKSEKKISPFPDSCASCKVHLNDSEVFISTFYDPPEDSKYRYTIEDFHKFLKSIPRSKPVLLGPTLFCIFIDDLPEVLKFSDLFNFAHDLKILAVRKNFWQVQDDLDQV